MKQRAGRSVATLVLIAIIALVIVPVVSANPGNWDRTLDAYEEVLNSLMAAYDKLEANPQDMTALTDMTNANMRSLELTQSLQGAQGDMTPAQLMRFMEMYQNYLTWATARM